MKYIRAAILILSTLLLSCTGTNNKNTSEIADKTISAAIEQEQLLNLVKQLYEWHENKSTNNDFIPMPDKQDIAYIGIDFTLHGQRMAELKATNFFTDEFMDNYNKVALDIDNQLKTNKLKWLVGDMPPFGNDANPWCNCQDSPENFWQSLTLNHFELNNDVASFAWTLGDNFEYLVKAKKENNQWKILYLQGFDFNEFFL